MGDRIILVYLPGALPRETTVQVRVGDGGRRVWWFNPRDGSETKPEPHDAPGGALMLPTRPDALDWIAVVEKDPWYR
jgi:hypothetical protein